MKVSDKIVKAEVERYIKRVKPDEWEVRFTVQTKSGSESPRISRQTWPRKEDAQAHADAVMSGIASANFFYI